MVQKMKSFLKRIRNEINLTRHIGKNVCFLGTMPKSGTWLCQYFFWSLERFSKNYEINLNTFDFKNNKVKNNLSINNSFILIGHSSCPGYKSSEDKKFGKKWSEIQYWNNGYNFINREIGKAYDLNFNKNLKIIYLYRNPISQFFSMYNYNFNHKISFYRKISELSFSEFIFNTSALDSYIKQFHTYRVMKKHYPRNIKLISYENLVRNPDEIFLEMCDFFGVFENTNENINIISKAVKFSSTENLKKIEAILGHSLANDQRGKNSHMQNYDKLKKEDMISDKDLSKIESIFNNFNYSLNDFKSDVIV